MNQGPRFVPKRDKVSLFHPLINRGGFHDLRGKKSKFKLGNKPSPP